MARTRIICLTICIIMLLAGLGGNLWRYKHYSAELASEIASQKTMLAELMAERDALKARPPEKQPCPTPIPANEPQSDVQAVLEPTDALNANANSNTSIDMLKKRYEDVLVSYFLLQQCEKNDAADYHIIISALAQEMASVNAPGRLQYDILTSAQGSYQELYSGNSCDASTLENLEADYRRFIDSTREQFLPR